MQLVHTVDYLKYDLGDGHPTRPVRAQNLVRLVREAGLLTDLVEPASAAYDELRLVHSAKYVEQVVAGWHPEWDGHRPWLHDLAGLIVGGTLGAARRIRDGQVRRVFHPMGAKHHAQRDTASGFCIYNDMAVAATVLADAGMKVLYVDWDAHHGDGVEFLLEDQPQVLTASIHNGSIFPGTGQQHRPEANAYNWPLPNGSDGPAMLSALDEVLDLGAALEPDIVLLAAGADGHRLDPLGGLRYEVDDFAQAARRVSDFSYEHCAGRLLAGGAGGYLADDWTPRVWFEVFKTMAAADAGR
ncbi:MAG: acetoin utilization protein AcuC [Actinomycetota bacterium]|nr:acetoin utilization protein AcuC [Actinomycetota bacterium]